jgi:hypothetical protein
LRNRISFEVSFSLSYPFISKMNAWFYPRFWGQCFPCIQCNPTLIICFHINSSSIRTINLRLWKVVVRNYLLYLVQRHGFAEIRPNNKHNNFKPSRVT